MLRTCPGYCSLKGSVNHKHKINPRLPEVLVTQDLRIEGDLEQLVTLLIYSIQASEKRHPHILSMPLKPKAPEPKHCKGLRVVLPAMQETGTDELKYREI